MILVCLQCGAQCVKGRACYWCGSLDQEDALVLVIKEDYVSGDLSLSEMEDQLELALRRRG